MATSQKAIDKLALDAKLNTYSRAIATITQSQEFHDLTTNPEFELLARSAVSYVTLAIKKFIAKGQPQTPVATRMAFLFAIGYSLGMRTQQTIDGTEPTHDGQ